MFAITIFITSRANEQSIENRVCNVQLFTFKIFALASLKGATFDQIFLIIMYYRLEILYVKIIQRPSIERLTCPWTAHLYWNPGLALPLRRFLTSYLQAVQSTTDGQSHNSLGTLFRSIGIFDLPQRTQSVGSTPVLENKKHRILFYIFYLVYGELYKITFIFKTITDLIKYVTTGTFNTLNLTQLEPKMIRHFIIMSSKLIIGSWAGTRKTRVIYSYL